MTLSAVRTGLALSRGCLQLWSNSRFQSRFSDVRKQRIMFRPENWLNCANSYTTQQERCLGALRDSAVDVGVADAVAGQQHRGPLQRSSSSAGPSFNGPLPFDITTFTTFVATTFAVITILATRVTVTLSLSLFLPIFILLLTVLPATVFTTFTTFTVFLTAVITFFFLRSLPPGPLLALTLSLPPAVTRRAGPLAGPYYCGRTSSPGLHHGVRLLPDLEGHSESLPQQPQHLHRLSRQRAEPHLAQQVIRRPDCKPALCIAPGSTYLADVLRGQYHQLQHQRLVHGVHHTA
jgi:hypothetical protein